MTEYEAASLTLQLAAVWVAAIVGAAQCSLIGYGLYIMRQASKQRDALHQETMAALNTRRGAKRPPSGSHEGAGRPTIGAHGTHPPHVRAITIGRLRGGVLSPPPPPSRFFLHPRLQGREHFSRALSEKQAAPRLTGRMTKSRKPHVTTSRWVAAIVGAAQCSLIGYGLYVMRQASKQRDALGKALENP